MYDVLRTVYHAVPMWVWFIVFIMGYTLSVVTLFLSVAYIFEKIEEWLKMIRTGYKLNDYDTCYESTTFQIIEHDGIVDITDLNSGHRFIVIKRQKRRKKHAKNKNINNHPSI